MPRGTVFKRGNRWAAVVDAPLGPDGKRRQKWVSGRTRKEADEKLTALQHKLQIGGYVQPSKETFGNLLHRWLETVSTTVRPTTYSCYERVALKDLLPALGHIPLKDLAPHHIESYLSSTRQRERKDGRPGSLSSTTLRSHYRVIAMALSAGVESDLLPLNIAKSVKAPRKSRKEIRAMDAAQMTVFLEEAESGPYYALFHLLLHSGLRRSEVLALRWRHIDLELMTMVIVDGLHQLRDRSFVFSEPKTSLSRRMVDLTPSSALVLKEHYNAQQRLRASIGMAPVTNDDLVFAHVDGRPLLPDVVSHAFLKTARRAGLGDFHVHSARHTHASLLLQQHTHPKVVAERLGHSSIMVTIDLYSHTTPGIQAAAALRFDEGLKTTSSQEAIPEAAYEEVASVSNISPAG